MKEPKVSDTEMMDRRVRASFKYGQEMKGLTDQGVAKLMGVHKTTYQGRKHSPDKITLQELRRLVRIFNISDEDILGMVRIER